MKVRNLFSESPYVQKVRFYKKSLAQGILIKDYSAYEMEVYEQLVALKDKIMEFDFCKKSNRDCVS